MQVAHANKQACVLSTAMCIMYMFVPCVFLFICHSSQIKLSTRIARHARL